MIDVHINDDHHFLRYIDPINLHAIICLDILRRFRFTSPGDIRQDLATKYSSHGRYKVVDKTPMAGLCLQMTVPVQPSSSSTAYKSGA